MQLHTKTSATKRRKEKTELWGKKTVKLHLSPNSKAEFSFKYGVSAFLLIIEEMTIDLILLIL